MDSSDIWSGNADTYLSMPSNDEFQFLNLDMDMDFDSHHTNNLMQQDNRDPMDAHMHDQSGQFGGQLDTLMHEPTTSTSTYSTVLGTPVVHGHASTEHLNELDAQIQFLQQQRKQAQERAVLDQTRNYYAHSNMIPPTPNSFEMQPSYYPRPDQQQMYDQYHMRLKEQEMSFTPLVSPAVTPLDAHFNIPDYTTPGGCFSPLSSPALHAQNERRAAYGAQLSDTSITTSPADMNIDSNLVPQNAAPITRKSTRKAPAKPKTTRVRQSPIVKPQRKKSTAISAQALADIIEPNPKQDAIRNSSSTASTEASENGSISPEHLSDMAPPPLPHSTKASPYLSAHNGMATQKSAIAVANLSPATPASLMLMRINQSPSQAAQQSPLTTTVAEEADLNTLDNFALPGPANRNKPQPSFIDTQSDGQTTPTRESNGSNRMGFQSLPSPVFARPALPKSATQSPQINAMSPNGTTRKTPQISANRNPKKRSNVSSVQVSPALRPRISPSIKPLLPGGLNSGGVSDETASLLLASKSNYQNILEGTVIDGVQYPKELERGLTSKRTSHKIAEQGRRNRINTALQEIATLLPSRTSANNSGGEKSDSGGQGDKNEAGKDEKKSGAQNANSKASTVELAIDYIKALKSDLAEAKRRAEEAEKKLEELAVPAETVTAEEAK